MPGEPGQLEDDARGLVVTGDGEIWNGGAEGDGDARRTLYLVYMPSKPSTALSLSLSLPSPYHRILKTDTRSLRNFVMAHLTDLGSTALTPHKSNAAGYPTNAARALATGPDLAVSARPTPGSLRGILVRLCALPWVFRVLPSSSQRVALRGRRESVSRSQPS